MLSFKECLEKHEHTFQHLEKMLTGQNPKTSTIGILTAWNPNGQAANYEENKKRNELLVSYLHRNGLGPLKIDGIFQGNIEQSFLVPNISKNLIIALGKEFEQESVIWGQKEFTDNEPYCRFEYISPKDGKVLNVRNHVEVNPEEVNKLKDMFSFMKKTVHPLTKTTNKRFVIPFFDPKYEN
jgi:hypothetical protein